MSQLGTWLTFLLQHHLLGVDDVGTLLQALRVAHRADVFAVERVDTYGLAGGHELINTSGQADGDAHSLLLR